MLSQSQCERVDVVLVSPRNPLNIGAAARAMANFGFHRLSIVAPFAMNWMEAKSAVGAPDLLREAKVYETLAEAVAHCTLVLGTGSLDRRRPVQAVLGLPEAGERVRRALGSDLDSGLDSGTDSEQDAGGTPGEASSRVRVAVVFGSEKHGLTSDDLSWCHALIAIETHMEQPSMNLGQAVAVCLYEISRKPEAERAAGQAGDETEALWMGRLPGVDRGANPDSGQLDRLAGLIEETMEAVNYATRGMRSANGEALRVLLRRLMPNEADLRRMMGLFRRILWQLGRRSGKV